MHVWLLACCCCSLNICFVLSVAILKELYEKTFFNIK
jgi:hypothetical protein